MLCWFSQWCSRLIRIRQWGDGAIAAIVLAFLAGGIICASFPARTVFPAPSALLLDFGCLPCAARLWLFSQRAQHRTHQNQTMWGGGAIAAIVFASLAGGIICVSFPACAVFSASSTLLLAVFPVPLGFGCLANGAASASSESDDDAGKSAADEPAMAWRKVQLR